MTAYDDNYEACEATYASLNLYTGEINPDEITATLRVAPSQVQKIGERRNGKYPVKKNAWFFSSKDQVKSKDVRRHIDWVLDQVTPSPELLQRIRDAGGETVVSCYWLSAQGHDGPTLSPRQMARMGELGLECWFDVYCQ